MAFRILYTLKYLEKVYINNYIWIFRIYLCEQIKRIKVLKRSHTAKYNKNYNCTLALFYYNCIINFNSTCSEMFTTCSNFKNNVIKTMIHFSRSKYRANTLVLFAWLLSVCLYLPGGIHCQVFSETNNMCLFECLFLYIAYT